MIQLANYGGASKNIPLSARSLAPLLLAPLKYSRIVSPFDSILFPLLVSLVRQLILELAGSTLSKGHLAAVASVRAAMTPTLFNHRPIVYWEEIEIISGTFCCTFNRFYTRSHQIDRLVDSHLIV